MAKASTKSKSSSSRSERASGLALKRKKSVAKKGPKPQTQTKPKSCLVLSPFGTYYDRYYEQIFAPAIRDADLEPHRADDLFRPSAIVQDIWDYVKDSVIMLADLTDKNPNVFYELGLAHALRKPVVLVTQSVDDVPFDLRQLRIVGYDVNEPDWGDTLHANIAKALREAILAPSTAILQPFQHHPTAQSTKTESQDALLSQLARDVNQLRSMVLQSRRGVMDPDEPLISAAEASRRIRGYLRTGLSEREIVSRLSSLRVSPSWTERRIARLRSPAVGTDEMSTDDAPPNDQG
jgi:hypothetical protein